MSIAEKWLATLPKEYKIAAPYIKVSNDFKLAGEKSVSYGLLTYAAKLCMDAYKSNSVDQTRKAELSEYLMHFMDFIEQLKTDQDLANKNFNLELNTAALRLFENADEQERSGDCNESIVKQFDAASVLFEATKQYNDQKLVPLIAERCTYARAVASRMRKSIKLGEKYVPLRSDKDTADKSSSDNLETILSEEDKQNPLILNNDNTKEDSFSSKTLETFDKELDGISEINVPKPKTSNIVNREDMRAVASAISTVAPKSRSEFNKVVDAQKYARLAVSALQFYDVDNAKLQLEKALQILNEEL